MIIKTKAIQSATSPTSKAGQNQELDVAFYLRRAFKDHKSVHVINDFKFTHNEETAQIDHLIIYPYGFILIESKSITGEVSVNKQGEWSRSYNSKWSGMPSPMKQVELQQRLFRDMIHEHRVKLLGTTLGIQSTFGGRCWDNLCAVSSNAIIDRDSMDKRSSEQLVKTEFLVDRINAIMKVERNILSKLFIESRPSFSNVEMGNTIKFILEVSINSPIDTVVPEDTSKDSKPSPPVANKVTPPKESNNTNHGKLTSSKIAKNLGLTTKEFDGKLVELGYCEKRDKHTYLTDKGKQAGIEFRKGKYNFYFLFPSGFVFE